MHWRAVPIASQLFTCFAAVANILLPMCAMHSLVLFAFLSFLHSLPSVTFLSLPWVTTCLEMLENLEMSALSTSVREISWISLKAREISGKKSCHGKVAIIVLVWMALVLWFFHYEITVNLIVWSLTLTLALQAWYEYHLIIIIIIIIIRNLYSAIMPLGGYRGAGGTCR